MGIGSGHVCIEATQARLRWYGVGEEYLDRRVVEIKLPGKRKKEDQGGGVWMCRERTCRR